jgi:tRNA A37 methylthiotransferase MiaB
MHRGYTREAYDALLSRTRAALPGVALSTDIIVGFCGETEDDFSGTLDLLRRVRYDRGYLFAYSRREQTHAARHYEDDVAPEVKSQRLAEAMAVYKEGWQARRRELVGSRQLVRCQYLQGHGFSWVCELIFLGSLHPIIERRGPWTMMWPRR